VVRVKNLIAALLVLGIAGCSSVGKPIAKEKISQIQVGVTTEAELIKMFGIPSTKTLDPSGNVVLSWVYSRAETKPETFIPVAGAFVGGVNTRLQQLTVLIGKKGRVERYTMNDAPGEVKYGH
jgi:outer membrane protein assembly factor BamE (lipoprotein component of BamABCDE complex)